MPAIPLNPGKTELMLDSLNDEIEYSIEGDDWVRAGLSYGASTTSWPASAVVTQEVAFHGRDYQPFPTSITHSDITTPKDRQRVTGAIRFRLRVTTATGTAGKSVVPNVASTRDRP